MPIGKVLLRLDAEPRHPAGHAGLRHLEHVLSSMGNTWTVDALRVGRNSVTFTVTEERISIPILLGDPRRENADFVHSTSWLGLRIQLDPARLGRAETELAARVFRALSARRFGDLRRVLERDLLLYSQASGQRGKHRLDLFWRRFDHRADWWRFFWPEHHYLDNRILPGERGLRVHLSTLECRATHLGLPLRSHQIFRDDQRSSTPDGELQVQVDIREEDVLAGTILDRLNEATRQVIEQTHPDTVHLATTCLPELAGVHPGATLRAMERDLGVHTIWTAKTRNVGLDVTQAIERLAARVPPSDPPRTDAVVVAGASDDDQRREATDLLARIGLRTTAFLLPELGLADPTALSEARAWVWFNPVPWIKVGDAPWIRRMRVVRHHPPFGVEGTVAWLARIIQVLEHDPPARWEQQLRDQFTRELAQIRERSVSHHVALIGDPDTLDDLVRHRNVLGFSVAQLLAELGFQVRCFCYLTPESAVMDRDPRPLSAGSIAFQGFRTPPELEALLADRVDLAFTHFTSDPRLARHGIHGFCEDAISPGLGGLIRTGRELLRRCEARPFPRHRRWLRGCLS